jgi:hypothetical protein
MNVIIILYSVITFVFKDMSTIKENGSKVRKFLFQPLSLKSFNTYLFNNF